MNHLEIHIGEKRYEFNFPANYGEFELRHLEVLANFVLTAAEDKLAYVKLIKDIIGIPNKVARQLKGEDLFYCELDDNEEVVMLPEFEYLKEPYLNDKSVLQQYKDFDGPLDRLKNISIEQVGFADMFSQAYAKEEDEENLNRLWAALYQPKGKPWTKEAMPEIEAMAKVLPKTIKAAALINYRGMMLDAQQTYSRVFKGGKSDGTERFAWDGTIIKLAKTQAFGPYQECKNIPFPKAMMLFEMNGIEVENLNRKK